MSTATTNDPGRGERRRKIIERGSDRIALITGRQGLPSSPRAIDDAAQSTAPSSTGAGPVKGTFEASDGVIGGKPSANTAEETPGEILPLASQSRTSPIAALGPRPRLFSSRRLNLCILQSERTRGFCALIIAVLVVLSYISYPLFGSHVVKSGSIIAARPLYVLLLTDVSIVLARLLNIHKTTEEPVDEKKVTKEENQNWDGAVKLLERGLVAYQSVRAVFIDCSIYMVIVICGLSHV